jgi:hypothetical protein
VVGERRNFTQNSGIVRPLGKPSAIRKFSRNGLLGTARAIDFPPRGCREAHYPHTSAAHKAGIYRCVVQGMDDRPSVEKG